MQSISSLITSTVFSYSDWKIDNDRLNEVFKPKTRYVVVLQHSTYWDFFILSMIRNENQKLHPRIKFIIKPQLVENYGTILEPLGAIASSKLEDKGAGGTERIVEQLKDKDDFVLFISPEGKLSKSEWRSGFYWIAQKTQAKIVVAGLDYNKHNFYLSDPIEGDNYDQIKENCIKEINNITPLYTDEVMYLSDQNKEKDTSSGFSYNMILIAYIIAYVIGYIFALVFGSLYLASQKLGIGTVIFLIILTYFLFF